MNVSILLNKNCLLTLHKIEIVKQQPQPQPNRNSHNNDIIIIYNL